MAEETEVLEKKPEVKSEKPVKDTKWENLVKKDKPAEPVVTDKPKEEKAADKTEKPKDEKLKEEVSEKTIADFDDDEAVEIVSDEGNLTVNGKQKEKDAPAEKGINLSRFKEISPDIDSEDKLFETLKQLHEENPKLKILAKGTKAIEQDKDIQGWKGWLSKNDEDLYKGHLVGQYEEAGYPTDKAIEKAEEKLEKAKADNPDIIEMTALQVRSGLNKAIETKGKHIIDALQNAEAGLTKETKEDTTKFNEGIIAKLNEKETFLGLKISSNPEGKKKVFGKAEKIISQGELATLLKDPDFLADAIFLHTNKKQLEKTISERSSNTRASMLDKIDKAPAVKPPVSVSRPSGEPKGFNSKNFR